MTPCQTVYVYVYVYVFTCRFDNYLNTYYMYLMYLACTPSTKHSPSCQLYVYVHVLPELPLRHCTTMDTSNPPSSHRSAPPTTLLQRSCMKQKINPPPRLQAAANKFFLLLPASPHWLLCLHYYANVHAGLARRSSSGAPLCAIPIERYGCTAATFLLVHHVRCTLHASAPQRHSCAACRVERMGGWAKESSA